MEPFAPPVEKEKLLAELTKEKFVRKTNYGKNDIYIFTSHDSPNLMKEVGRLRELSFRSAGGGTGKEYDLDDYDLNDNPYKQLIVWEPEKQEILGGYRYFFCKDCKFNEKGYPLLATTGLFKFSEKFIKEFLPYTLELGRSFVQPKFQARSENRQAIFALDNLWDGLGAITFDTPSTQYFFGKVIMYLNYNKFARDLLLYFLNKYFPDPDNLLYPVDPLKYHTPEEELAKIFTGSNYQENYRLLSQNVRLQNEVIPPLINSYMSLSPTMRTFGTALHTKFGNVEETGIMIKIQDIYKTKKERHILTYQR
jgi:hypothetical protein